MEQTCQRLGVVLELIYQLGIHAHQTYPLDSNLLVYHESPSTCLWCGRDNCSDQPRSFSLTAPGGGVLMEIKAETSKLGGGAMTSSRSITLRCFSSRQILGKTSSEVGKRLRATTCPWTSSQVDIEAGQKIKHSFLLNVMPHLNTTLCTRICIIKKQIQLLPNALKIWKILAQIWCHVSSPWVFNATQKLEKHFQDQNTFSEWHPIHILQFWIKDSEDWCVAP